MSCIHQAGPGVCHRCRSSEYKAEKGMDLRPARDPNPKKAFGDTKPPMHLLSGTAILHACRAMVDGDEKYGPANWRKDPVTARTYGAALLRHFYAWLDGQDIDPGSTVGAHHLGAVIANAAILLDAQEHGSLIDDRAPKGPFADAVKKYTRSPQGEDSSKDSPAVPLHHHVPGTEIEEAPKKIGAYMGYEIYANPTMPPHVIQWMTEDVGKFRTFTLKGLITIAAFLRWTLVARRNHGTEQLNRLWQDFPESRYDR